MKKKMTGWICGLLPGEREYRLNNVTYFVSARFEGRDSENSIRSRLERIISNDLVDLIEQTSDGRMAEEYVYSAAGKED